jgi:hypothetical protein
MKFSTMWLTIWTIHGNLVMDIIVFLNQINTANAIDFMDEMNYMEALWKDEKLFFKWHWPQP